MYVLNFTPSVAGSLLVLGSSFDSIFIPSPRAFGGINERNRRADLDRGEKGLNFTRTSVRNRVIISRERMEERMGFDESAADEAWAKVPIIVSDYFIIKRGNKVTK